MSKLFFLAPALFLAGSALAKPPMFTEADKGKKVSVKVGQAFTVALPSNPSTGYSWYLLSGASPWKLVGRKYMSHPADPGMVGVGGDEVFTFKATGAGSGFLRLLYLRPFEEKLDLTGAWQVKITIEK